MANTQKAVKAIVPPLGVLPADVGIKPSKAKKQAKKAKESPKAEVKAKGGIGKTITAAIVAGKLSNDEILALVKKTYPTCKTTYACVAWYKTKLRKAGDIE